MGDFSPCSQREIMRTLRVPSADSRHVQALSFASFASFSCASFSMSGLGFSPSTLSYALRAAAFFSRREVFVIVVRRQSTIAVQFQKVSYSIPGI